VINVLEEINDFISKGNVNFPDEVVFASALCKATNFELPDTKDKQVFNIEKEAIRSIIDKSENGFLAPEQVGELLRASGIPLPDEAVVKSPEEASLASEKIGFPVAMKVVGPVHKSDVGGVSLNIRDRDAVVSEYNRIMKIPGAKSVLIQKMLKGTELFAGVKAEGEFGHLLMTGFGGIYIEILKDVSSTLTPVSLTEAQNMVRSLKGYGIIKGSRGQKGLNESSYIDIICRLSALVDIAPEIAEMDLNPLLAAEESVIVADARIRIQKR
jgi:acetyltransferase